MNLPIEVWEFIFKYSRLIELVVCTKFCSNNRNVNLAIAKTLKIRYFENFLTLLYCDALSSDEINLSVHSFSKGRKKSHCPNDFCEVLSSSFTLWKF